jgi:hypothetical protein
MRFRNSRQLSYLALNVSKIAVSVSFCLMMVGISALASISAVHAGDGTINPANGDVDFNAHFRFPPTDQQLADVKSSLDQMALGMCDATDGQLRARQITLSQGQPNEDLGDFWLNALPGRSGLSFSGDGSSLGTLGSHVDMLADALTVSDIYLHEFGHHAFGLGDEYDEQRRFGGACGIGAGFQTGTENEQNHSIMQQSGSAQCVGGSSVGNACIRNSDCPGAVGIPAGTCQLVLMSELTTDANHDPVRGTGGSCPAVVPLNKIKNTGTLQSGAPTTIFDGSSFPNAQASASVVQGIEIIDSAGAAPGPVLNLYYSRTGAGAWQVSALVDAGIVGGTAGTPKVIEQWKLTFNADGSLATISETNPSMTVTGLSSGGANMTIAQFFGTPNPSATAGSGRDGLVETAATSGVALTGNATVPSCGDNAYCARVWNSTTNRYEATQQSEMHANASDWATLAANYPFIVPPAGLPGANPPATCFRPVKFVENVVGSDQVLLVLDKSGSMSWSSVAGIAEVCGNGADDNADGTVDEAACGDPRVNFVRAAANAYLDLQQNSNVDVGVMTFNDTANLDQPIGALNSGNLASYKAIVNAFAPGGNTGIGDALDASVAEFSRVATLGRSRTAYLMTDGFNTSGVSPADAAARLQDIGVRVHVIPAGSEVNDLELGGVASKTSGKLFPAASANELIAVYAELAGLHRGAAMVLPRTNFELSVRGNRIEGSPDDEPRVQRIPPREYTLPIPVEKNAKSLVAFVSTRNARIRDWSVNIELRGPNGEVFGPGSPELTAAPQYLFLNIQAPSAGTWKLVTTAIGPAFQQATAVAFVDNPDPDFFVDVKPHILSGPGRVKVTANPSFVTRMENGVTIKARLRAPDGNVTNIDIKKTSTGAWEGLTPSIVYDGLYRIEAKVDVGPDARPAAGERIFAGPERPPIEIDPFVRYASTAFNIVGGRGYNCSREHRGDCDQDGIGNDRECPGFPADIDGDGRPNAFDSDADGDQIPDSVERTLDLNHNHVPDMCEKSPPIVAPPPKEHAENCSPLRGRFVSVEQYGRRWRMVDRNVSIALFERSAADARTALSVVRHYGITDICRIGTPRPSLTYLLADGKAPEGPFDGEHCTEFEPASLAVQKVDGKWSLTDRRVPVFVFGATRDRAEDALDVIRKYGFNHSCRAGTSQSAMVYLRR